MSDAAMLMAQLRPALSRVKLRGLQPTFIVATRMNYSKGKEVVGCRYVLSPVGGGRSQLLELHTRPAKAAPAPPRLLQRLTTIEQGETLFYSHRSVTWKGVTYTALTWGTLRYEMSISAKKGSLPYVRYINRKSGDQLQLENLGRDWSLYGLQEIRPEDISLA